MTDSPTLPKVPQRIVRVPLFYADGRKAFRKVKRLKAGTMPVVILYDRLVFIKCGQGGEWHETTVGRALD